MGTTCVCAGELSPDWRAKPLAGQTAHGGPWAAVRWSWHLKDDGRPSDTTDVTVTSEPASVVAAYSAAALDLSSAPSAVHTMPAAVAVVPTYNEAGNVKVIWHRLRQALPHVGMLIVDDNSPDGTGAIAEALAAQDPLTWVLHRPGKAGLGRAYTEGMAWALDRGARYIVEMDADGSHDPSGLTTMLQVAADGADLVIGSRYVPGGSTIGWSRRRHALSRGGNSYVRHMLGLDVRDATSGFRVYSAGALRRIGLTGIVSQGYCFQIEMTLATAIAGGDIREVPIRFTERERGKSKMSWAVTVEALLRVTHWSLAGRRCPKRPACSVVTAPAAPGEPRDDAGTAVALDA